MKSDNNNLLKKMMNIKINAHNEMRDKYIFIQYIINFSQIIILIFIINNVIFIYSTF